MNILVLNGGSSTLKYQLFDMENKRGLAKGLVDKIGLNDTEMIHQPGDKEKVMISADISNHYEAVNQVLKVLVDKEYGVIDDLRQISAIGHRIAHGGSIFNASVLVDDKVIAALEDLIELAPLHNGVEVSGIKACREMISVPMVTVFDTSFHYTMPPESYHYAIPFKYYKKYHIRRYGFHGTSHRYVSLRAAELMNKQSEDLKIITCHLGNGSSIAAIDKGKVIDTSMGFTPLAGLVMGTRSGDIDPSIVPILMEKENLSTQDIKRILNKECGLLGVSELSSDMRDIEAAEKDGNEKAALAHDIYNRQVLRFIGAYIAELDGLDVLVFTAGIGENSAKTRKDICRKLTYMGLEINDIANLGHGVEKEISSATSKIKVYVIPTNEELMIARDTYDLVQNLN